jgi:hypothetical protein
VILRPRIFIASASVPVFALAAVTGLRAQVGFGGGIPASQLASGYGGSGGGFSTGYGVGNGQIGAGYQSAAGLYSRGYAAPRAQTTIALGPLYSAITSVPGWYGHSPSHRRARRSQADQGPPRSPPYDDSGKILWPSTIPDDEAATALKRPAEEAVRAVVREFKDTGHGSVRPVINAKNKLSAFERKVLPEVKAKNVTDGAALETFFYDLDKALDSMTYTY